MKAYPLNINCGIYWNDTKVNVVVLCETILSRKLQAHAIISIQNTLIMKFKSGKSPPFIMPYYRGVEIIYASLNWFSRTV